MKPFFKELNVSSVAVFFQHLTNGLTLGGIYALIALGYTMVYGILKFINFAHGDILMVGAYMGMFAFDFLRGDAPLGAWTFISFLLAMVFSAVFCAVLGMFIEKVAYKPLRRAARLAPLLSAIGVSFILSNGAAWMWGTQSRKLNYPFDNSPMTIMGISITPHQILVLAVSFVMMIALKLFVDRSRMGKAMRATSLDQDTAQLMGINVNRTISLTFAIGSALAAIAGVLLCSSYSTLMPTTGSMPGIKAFTAAVFGGIGSIPGAFLGGILLGIIESLAKAYISTQLANSVVFAVLIVVLLVRPAGLLGKYVPEKV